MKPKELAYWINEREQMRIRKENNRYTSSYPQGELSLRYGYSADPHMGTVRYCNVHRENDKVTRWMRENWSTKDSPVWWFVLGRMLNYIPTLEDIVEFGVYGPGRGPDVLPSLDGLADGLKARRDAGEKVFTSAYTISTCGKRMDKIDYVTDWVCGGIVKHFGISGTRPYPDGPDTLDYWHRMLTCVDGLGSFLAAQVVADLKNTPGHPLQTAPDRATWCAPGPGSLRGLQAFWSRPVTPRTFAKDIQECYAATMPLVDNSVAFIDMQDFQNCLCEFSKYDRVSRGAGHARNKYTPG